VGQELRGLDPLDSILDQPAELLALLVGDGGSQVLNLGQPLTDEDDLSHFGNTRHPGVTDELGIERQ
jgi:hypothetical protein